MTTRNGAKSSVLRVVLVAAAGTAVLASQSPARAQVAGMLPGDAPAPTPAPVARAPEADQGSTTPGTTKAPSSFDTRIVIPVLRLGSASGSGKIESTCSGNGCGSVTYGTADTDDQSSGALAADVLFRTTGRLRLGVGGMWLPSPRHLIKFQDGTQTKFESGDELHALGVVEGLFPTSTRFAFTLRAQAGVIVLIPGEDHERIINQEGEKCRGLQTCINKHSGFVGPSFGLSAGILYDVGGVRLRADFLFQRYSVPLFDEQVGDGTYSASQTTTLSGTRTWLMGGVEL
jgi:hypothetical protein